MKKLIKFFANKHLFSNFVFIGILAAGIFFWNITGKEELPDMTFDIVRITTTYSGATAHDVEQLVTWPIEDELQSLDGIERITSSSTEGTSSISVELQKDQKDRNTLISEIRNSVLNVDLPEDVIEQPVIKEFKSSTKAVMDIGLYMNDVRLLTEDQRRLLQAHVRTLEKKLKALPEISRIDRNGYREEELHILLNPPSLMHYRIPISTIITEIRNSNLKQPAGSLESSEEERVSIDAELDNIKSLEELPIQGTFESTPVFLKQLASVKDTFEDNSSIVKINGREGVIINVIKNSSAGILKAVDVIKKETKGFQKSIASQGISIVLLDDESRDVRNRISIIGSNGLIGFILILIFLFIFLSFKAGFWVAIGIPFTFSMTMIIASLHGYTINNITLSAVIIVMGMIVDDAIVVAENIMRLRTQGRSAMEAAVEGAAYVLLPITASVLTTCAAFLPLLAFSGQLSMLTDSIPPIVSLMLLASLIESIFILPAHMSLHVPRWIKVGFSLGTLPVIERFYSRKKTDGKDDGTMGHWFHDVEKKYAGILERLLHFRVAIIIFFVLFVFVGIFLVKNKMSFALFPREEATEVRLMAEAPDGNRTFQTARLSEQLENVFLPYLGKEVVGYRTLIGRSFHRSSAKENVLMMRIELVNADKREKSLNQLMSEWKKKISGIKKFKDIKFSGTRFGSSSGSPIEVVIQENDDAIRRSIAGLLAEKMEATAFLRNVEIGEPYQAPEYKIDINRPMVKRLNISPISIGLSFRTALDGTVLYQFVNKEEEKNVRISIPPDKKRSIGQILSVPVANSSDYLVPLREVVTLRKTDGPSEIDRIDMQRSLTVYSDITPGAEITPIKVAQYLEENIFPELNRRNPGTIFSFEGEIKATRESSGFFPLAVTMVLFLIYTVLALQFNSLSKPFIVMMAIPPAAASVAIIFCIHGMSTFGFFGIIGTLGLCGVVVNDAIVLLTKLNDEYHESGTKKEINKSVAEISSTRLRAVLLTTMTTVAGLLPTAYGITGYDSMLAEMMLALAWGLIFGTIITLVLVPSMYSLWKEISIRLKRTPAGGEL